MGGGGGGGGAPERGMGKMLDHGGKGRDWQRLRAQRRNPDVGISVWRVKYMVIDWLLTDRLMKIPSRRVKAMAPMPSRFNSTAVSGRGPVRSKIVGNYIRKSHKNRVISQ